jgi:hypothetical protein
MDASRMYSFVLCLATGDRSCARRECGWGRRCENVRGPRCDDESAVVRAPRAPPRCALSLTRVKIMPPALLTM